MCVRCIFCCGWQSKKFESRQSNDIGVSLNNTSHINLVVGIMRNLMFSVGHKAELALGVRFHSPIHFLCLDFFLISAHGTLTTPLRQRRSSPGFSLKPSQRRPLFLPWPPSELNFYAVHLTCSTDCPALCAVFASCAFLSWNGRDRVLRTGLVSSAPVSAHQCPGHVVFKVD